MKADISHLEAFRLRDGRMGSDESYGANGFFLIPHRGIVLQIIASDGAGWDHVSVVPIDARTQRKLYRTPTWAEMCFVKDLFWDKSECAIQYHPVESDYRNAHEYCLHLWKPQDVVLPTPDPLMVAPLAGTQGERP